MEASGSRRGQIAVQYLKAEIRQHVLCSKVVLVSLRIFASKEALA